LALTLFDAFFATNSRPEPEVVQDVRAERSGAGTALTRGAALFAKEWVPRDPMSHGGDGLGPVYNESSCVACHNLGAPGGAGPESKNIVLVTARPNGRGVARDLDQIHPGFRDARSIVLHRYGTDPEYGTWRRRFSEGQRGDPQNDPPSNGNESIEARIQMLKQQTARDRRPRDRSPHPRRINGATLTFSERNTPALFGAGRIDAIPPEVLLAVAQSQPSEVRGRVSRLREGRIGRFGWKAQVASLDEFVRAACANELGLEVPRHAQAASPLDPQHRANGLDLTESECAALVAYLRGLPAPVAVDPDGPQGTQDIREGRRLFADVGCIVCHTPSLDDVRGIYSDLLLHEMDPSSSDSAGSYGGHATPIPDGPSPGEWRTPPLWGYRDSGPYLHDGRAQDLEEAVALHGGQGRTSALRFFALSGRERSQVEAFLKSLCAPSATAAPGVVLADEMESRFEREDRRTPESLVWRQREEALARDQRQRHAVQLRRRAEDAAHRARVRFPIARALEKIGNLKGALEFYSTIALEAPDTEEGHQAAARVAAIRATADHLDGPSP
jgi:CxxC motif-containing protein (DUF1111 family)